MPRIFQLDFKSGHCQVEEQGVHLICPIAFTKRANLLSQNYITLAFARLEPTGF